MMARVAQVRNQLHADGITTELIVVDDASTDGSVEMLREFPEVRLIEQSVNGGYGKALQAGFRAARGEWVSFIDMDRTYHIEDLPELIVRARREGLDMLYGQRPFMRSGMPATRGLGNWLFTSALRVFFGSRISDVCTGFRIFHGRHISEILRLDRAGLNFSIQLTVHTLLHRWRIAEHPIRYQERLGESKLSVVKDGFAFLWVILRARAWH
jgi:glycosyltransferase involved in cell wall biosynthesis